MFGFFVGWGVFWLLVWLFTFMLGIWGKSDGLMFTGGLGTVICVIYLIAVFLGKLATLI